MTKEKKTKSITVKDRKTSAIPSNEYAATLADLKKRIREAQIKAANAANQELLKLYWSIGETIVGRQEKKRLGEQFYRKAGQRFAK